MARKERSSPPDEKISVNLGPVDLGRMDLLVEEGFYTTRTDLIRSAIRRLLDDHKEPIDQAIHRQALAVGVVHWNRKALEEARERQEQLDLRVIGVLRLGSDITPELADEVISSIRVFGHLSAPASVRRRLASKISREA
jgi:Arc/MetJ-type ribon-helix-helix transcriptional regulator